MCGDQPVAIGADLDTAVAGGPDLAAEHLASHHDSAAALFFAALAPEHGLARLRTAISTVAPGATAAMPGD